MFSESKILIVDDNVNNIRLLKLYLEDQNYKIFEATNSDVAISTLEKHNIDLILLDIMMPRVNGFELCKIIKSNPNTVEIPIIFQSALIDSETLIEAFDAGAVDYLKRPIEKEELKARVKIHLELKHSKFKLKKELSEKEKAEKALKEIEKKLKKSQEIAKMGNWEFDFESQKIFFSEELVGILDLDKDAHDFYEYVDKLSYNGDKDRFLRTINDHFSGMVRKVDEYKLFVNKDRFKYISLNSEALFDKENKIIKLFGTVQDITTIKEIQLELEKHKNRLEELIFDRTLELRLSERKFRNLFEASNDAIIVTDLEGNYIEFNDIAFKRLGLPKEELTISNIKHFYQGQGSESVSEYFTDVIEKGQKVFTTSYINNKKEKIHIEMNGKLIKHKNKNAILHISRDITKRKKEETKKLDIIIETEEKERKRFAKDLHDGLGATLSAVKMYLNIVRRVEPGSEKASEMLNEAILLVERASKNAKEIALNISPHDLSNFGLSISLQNFCERLNSIGTINVELDIENFKIKLKDKIELNIFRTINELINNTLKYSEAENIFLKLTQKDNKALIYYSDDGIGFEYNKIMNKNKAGTGLDNVINRTIHFGGFVIINSEPGKGMSAEITIEI